MLFQRTSPPAVGQHGTMASSAERTALIVVAVLLCAVGAAADGCNLTAGFAKVELHEGDFLVQSPYDVPVDQRYRYDAGTGVRTFWVYAADKAFKAVTPTNPRMEVRLAGHDYSSGVWQFEGDVYVPAGTSGTSVVQIHNENGGTPATTMMLHSTTAACGGTAGARWRRASTAGGSG
jgi:hypothetical protein